MHTDCTSLYKSGPAGICPAFRCCTDGLWPNGDTATSLEVKVAHRVNRRSMRLRNMQSVIFLGLTLSFSLSSDKRVFQRVFQVDALLQTAQPEAKCHNHEYAIAIFKDERATALMNSENPAKPIKYRRPPIIERVVAVVGDVAPETFYARFESWKQIIQSYFPDYDPIKDWKLNLEMKEGVPVLKESLPEVQITHRFWRCDGKGRRFFSMKMSPNTFILNLHSGPDSPHDFDELNAEFRNWLPQWMTHFGVKFCLSVALDYINAISPYNTPQFIGRNNAIDVGRALTVFAGVPSQHLGIVPPYDCQMGLMIDPNRPAIFGLRVFGGIMPPPFYFTVRVDFHAEVSKNTASLTGNHVLSEAEFLHTVVLQQFEAIFTAEAKQTFEPI